MQNVFELELQFSYSTRDQQSEFLYACMLLNNFYFLREIGERWQPSGSFR